jgi:hypothetical protein
LGKQNGVVTKLQWVGKFEVAMVRITYVEFLLKMSLKIDCIEYLMSLELVLVIILCVFSLV